MGVILVYSEARRNRKSERTTCLHSLESYSISHPEDYSVNAAYSECSKMDIKWVVKRAKSGEILYYQNTITGEKRWPNSPVEILTSSCNKTADLQSSSNGKGIGQSVCNETSCFNELVQRDYDQACDLDTFPHVVHITTEGLTVHTLDPAEPSSHHTYTKHEEPNTGIQNKELTKIPAHRKASSNSLIADINSNHFEKPPDLKLNVQDCPNIFTGDVQSNDGTCDKRLQESNSRRLRKRDKYNIGMEVWNGFRCSKCATTFTSEDKLSKHQTFHSKNFKCNKCYLSFTSAVFLAKHKKIHEDRNVMRCQQCDEEFNDKETYSDHVREHTNGKCKKKFASKTEQMIKQKFHKGGKFKCDQCDKTFTHRSTLIYHIKLHRSGKEASRGNPENIDIKKEVTKKSEETTVENGEDKKFKCELCEKVFSNSGSLCVHRRRHSSERPFKCSQCHKGFFEVGDLRKHLRTHTGEKPYSCKQCNKKFTLSGNLKVHLRVHTGEKPFKCKICEKTFRRSNHLAVHLRTHSGEKPFKCPICDKAFSRRTCLTMHLRVHSGEKPFKCSKCSKSFSGKSDLTKHQRTHTGEKPYKCENCQKCFSQLNHLKNHRRIHTGEKPFECPICHHSFAFSQYLAKHKRIHSGEKPHECTQCKKSFAQRGNLLNHLRIHSDERPYTCAECPLAFKDPSSLAKHRKLHTGARPYPCSVCKKAFKRGSHLRKHLESVHNLDDSTII